MHFSLSIITALLAGATFALGRAVPSELTTRSVNYGDGLFVQVCGQVIPAGEQAFIYLGDGVAPYTLTAVDTNGTFILDIASNVTVARYNWGTAPVPPIGSQFKVNVTDSTGAQAQSTVLTVGEHPGKK